MSAKQIVFDQDAREKIRNGVRNLARAVKTTLGPRGRNVVIEKSYGAPTVTKDGVTVAKEIEFKDPWENMGAQIVKQVASQTSDKAGDGTTTATVLAEAIVDEGLKNVAAGVNPIGLRDGINKAIGYLTAELAKRAKAISTSAEVAQVGTIAANGDAEIGKMLAEAMDKVGKDGVITVEEGKGLETEVEWVEGMQFDKGYVSPHFINDRANLRAEFEDAYIFLYDKKLSSIKDLMPLLEQLARGQKQVVFIAEDIEGEALATLVVNRLRGTLNIAAVKAPGFGDRRKEMLKDIAAVTGGEVISEELGHKLENVRLAQLGRAKRVRVSKDETTVIEGQGTPETIQERIKGIRSELDNTDSDYAREKLQERLAKLAGGVAVIRVGAATETELKEKKHRFEDALSTARSAVEEGIVAGGGVTLIHAVDAVKKAAEALHGDERTGAMILMRALEEPARQIAANAGAEGSVVVNAIKNNNDGKYGYDAATDQYVPDMFAAGIVDPAKVTRTALQNAASIGALILTTEAVIADKPEKEDKSAPPMPGGDMGGMDF